MTATTGFDARSTGSAFRSRKRSRFSASASARKCSPATLAIAFARIRRDEVEVGYYPIDPTEHGHKVCDCRFPDRVYQWHREGFDLPNGAVLLAKGRDFEAQAFSYGPSAFGLQFHPEVTLPMICRWSARASERLDCPGARPLHRHFEGWFRHDRAVARWCSAFLDSWLARGLADARQSSSDCRA